MHFLYFNLLAVHKNKTAVEYFNQLSFIFLLIWGVNCRAVRLYFASGTIAYERTIKRRRLTHTSSPSNILLTVPYETQSLPWQYVFKSIPMFRVMLRLLKIKLFITPGWVLFSLLHSILGIYGHRPHKLTVTRKTEEEIITRKIACMPVKTPTRDWQVNTFQTEKIKYGLGFIEIPNSFCAQIKVIHHRGMNFMSAWAFARACVRITVLQT